MLLPCVIIGHGSIAYRLIDHDDLRPTGQCFTDALEFLDAMTKPGAPNADTFTLVHARCSIGGVPFAHAWVETLDRRWQAGMVNRRLRVFYARPRSMPLEFNVEREWRYTVAEADAENERTLMYGPWVDELLALCEAARVEREGV